MIFPYAHKTAARLAYSLNLDELTVMERAIARQHAIQSRSGGEYRRIIGYPRSSDCSGIFTRLPLHKWIQVHTELCRYQCGCGTELFWAYVDGQLDGGPNCPKCMAPYWEAWRRVLYRIADYAVSECRRKAEELQLVTGSCFSVDVILAGGIDLDWNPGHFTWRRV